MDWLLFSLSEVFWLDDRRVKRPLKDPTFPWAKMLMVIEHQLPTIAIRVIATIVKKFIMPVFNEES